MLYNMSVAGVRVVEFGTNEGGVGDNSKEGENMALSKTSLSNDM